MPREAVPFGFSVGGGGPKKDESEWRNALLNTSY